MRASVTHNEPNQLAYGLANCIVVIPAHNEADDIGNVISDIRQHCDFPVIVVDDASTDRTIDSARAGGASVIPLAVQLGAWGATQAGIRYALHKRHTLVVTMDADGQHLAESLPQLLQPVFEDVADVVIGACTDRGSLLRKIAWRLMKRASGLRPEDLTSGFRVYNWQAIRRLAGWQATLLEYQDVGVLAMLQASGLRIHDVSVTMRPRRHGISRVFHSWASVAYYMGYTLLLAVTKRGIKHRAHLQAQELD
jgi:glycosyltransferase involved in cell wall biosynthesis